MRARWPSGLFVMRKLSPPGWIATSRVSFEMSTPTLCAAVELIFSQSSSCLGGMTPGCPFRPLGKGRGGQTTGQSFQIGALTTHPLPPPACVVNRPAAPDPAGSDGKTIRQGALRPERAAFREPLRRAGAERPARRLRAPENDPRQVVRSLLREI